MNFILKSLQEIIVFLLKAPNPASKHNLNNKTSYVNKDYKNKDNRVARFLGFTLRK
jgi:hypothetical protein